jgi:cyclophilin family peptidyl-prolyl cis-trans isomerase
MPEQSFILCVKTQRETPCIWIEVPNEHAPKVVRKFMVVGTGWEYEDTGTHYIGSFFRLQETEVWHLFERLG